LAKYTNLKTELKTKTDELEAWIKTGPERNEENQAKFMAMQKKIQTIQQELDQF
jgi:chaperonin cofactor prefoldin